MQNIQDLKEKFFFESKNIIDILDKINNVDELLSKQDLVDELADRISFLRLLEKNIDYFIPDHSVQTSENHYHSFASDEQETQDSGNEVTEEEAIFNNELNEIDEFENENFADESVDEDAVFNSQIEEIAENEYHENIISFVEENTESVQENSDNGITDEEAIFSRQLNEIDENEVPEKKEIIFSFVDEERILADAEPDNEEDISEEIFADKTTEEEAVFNNQLNEIDENEEEEKITKTAVRDTPERIEIIPSIFDTETLDDEILIEETEEQFVTSGMIMEQGEMGSDTSNVENILSEIKNDLPVEEKGTEAEAADVHDRRKIVEIDKHAPENDTERHASDESFEDLDAYHEEKKIRLANIKGLKAVQSLFDDDPLERDIPKEKPPVLSEREDLGSILKTNIPTHLMEAEKTKPEFKLDLNDRIAFSKMLFGGSQTDLNDTVAQLNHFKNLEEAKEYLSDLYYERKWSKVDEYAQRLWILVENKFL